jgi:hypothetical protein
MKLITKLSIKQIIGGKSSILDKVISDKEKEHVVARILGVATGMKTGEGDNGPWTGLTGQFKGINTDTGEEFQSGVLFMPNVAQDMVIGALMGESKAVEFGFEISVKYDESSATSYVYSARPLFESSDSDPIKLLEARMGKEALKQLEKKEVETKDAKKK